MSFELGYGDIAFFLPKKDPFLKVLPIPSSSRAIFLSAHDHQVLAKLAHSGDLSRANISGYGTRQANRFSLSIHQFVEQIFHNFKNYLDLKENISYLVKFLNL